MGYADGKKFEEQVYNYLLEMPEIYSKRAQKVVELIKRNIIKNYRIEDCKITLKPPASNALYGGNTEPKTDLRIITPDRKTYNISIKKTEKERLITIGDGISFLYVINYDLLPDEYKSEALEISKLPKHKSAWTYKRMKGVSNENDYINKYINEERLGAGYNIEKIKEAILPLAKDDDKIKFNEEVREGQDRFYNFWIKLCQDVPNHALKVIHEAATGMKKFQGGEGSANCIVSPDRFYFLDDNYDNEFLRKQLEKYLDPKNKKMIRYQSIPKRGERKISIKALSSGDYDMMARDFLMKHLCIKF